MITITSSDATHQPTANGAHHHPQDVINSKVRVPNLTQFIINSSDANHQPMANGAHHLPQDVIKSKVRVDNLTQVTYLPQMHLSNPMPMVLLTFYIIKSKAR